MYCRKCGALNSDKGNFCAKCGYPLREASRTAPEAPRPDREPPGSPPPDFTVHKAQVRRPPPPATPPYYAGFWKRFGAHVIDEVILSVIIIVLIVIVAAAVGVPLELSGVDEDVIAPLILLYFIALEFLVNWLYFTISECSGRQATLGKMALGIIVTDMEGKRISFARANGRFWSKIISGLFFNIGYIIAGFTERKQALHDLIAATLVINS
jgi:uncharacterized RDD family membrane protein YckC